MIILSNSNQIEITESDQESGQDRNQLIRRVGALAQTTVFKLENQEKYPDYRDVKILVKPLVPEGLWIEYAEADLDENGEIQFYSQQALIDEAFELIEQK